MQSFARSFVNGILHRRFGAIEPDDEGINVCMSRGSKSDRHSGRARRKESSRRTLELENRFQNQFSFREEELFKNRIDNGGIP